LLYDTGNTNSELEHTICESEQKLIVYRYFSSSFFIFLAEFVYGFLGCWCWWLIIVKFQSGNIEHYVIRIILFEKDVIVKIDTFIEIDLVRK